MSINYILLYIYIVGMIIAFILGCVEAYLESKENHDISKFPAAVSAMAFMSWWYVYHFIKTRILV